MGDFNDYPTDNSMFNTLDAKWDTSSILASELVNLTGQFINKQGTNKYQHQWHILDQFIANQNLLNSTQSLYSSLNLVKIFNASWLLTEENDGFGQKPFRTYNGFKYINGYSDHLPIFMDVLYGN